MLLIVDVIFKTLLFIVFEKLIKFLLRKRLEIDEINSKIKVYQQEDLSIMVIKEPKRFRLFIVKNGVTHPFTMNRFKSLYQAIVIPFNKPMEFKDNIKNNVNISPHNVNLIKKVMETEFTNDMDCPI